MKRLYQATRRVADTERCELCAAPLATQHEHLYDPKLREVRCACQGCALIIPTSERSPYRRVPRRFERVEVDATRWLERLGIPVGIAALIRRDDGRVVVAYPGPVGLVESEVDADAFAALCAEVPQAARLEPEVEAIVWASVGVAGAWRCGIDVVFEMVSALRKSWVGLAGGPDAPAAALRVLAEHGR